MGDEDERIKCIISCISGHNLSIHGPRNSGGYGLQGEGKHCVGRGGVGQGEEGGRVAVGGGKGWRGVAEEVQVAVGGGVKWGGV